MKEFDEYVRTYEAGIPNREFMVSPEPGHKAEFETLGNGEPNLKEQKGKPMDGGVKIEDWRGAIFVKGVDI